ncbi:MAG: Rrf2 family transcriptional regulator [Planctomycetota bacterium]
MLNRSSECAIAAMSLLAELWCEDGQRLTATEVADRRRLPRPFVAKVLTILSQVGLVRGAPGPRGGYCLGRAPEEITLLDITRCFEREDPAIACPHGPDYCGVGDNKCPIHDEVVALQEQKDAFLARTTLAVFCNAG